MNLDYLFDNFSDYAFRLETLPYFASDTRKPGYTQFRETGSLPEDHNSEWRSEVREGTRVGRTYQRLRLFSSPLTEYERYESASYSLSLRAGEDIRSVNRSSVPDARDFWIFDDKWIAYMKYDDRGELVTVDVHEMTEAEKNMARSWMHLFEKAPQISTDQDADAA